MSQLEEMADRLQVAPEVLIQMSLLELLSRPDDAFQKAANYVLAKNIELYRRLA